MADDYVKGMLSQGEVVLINTRQHWMAAIRFALKPILLILGIALLAVINSWLNFDGTLSFINDIVQFLLVIGVILAVIWLPFDLVRWYSRKYVLTNRRAMRMSGIFRKKSFDSSLEQINDIGFVQSVIGRSLGYADLTLYTASDTANETYDQLMDGTQFKKMVLDAKEAIRAGAPLTELPEGFIVKGGTNAASMRADGKIQEAAATDAESGGAGPADAGGATTASATAPEPQPVVEPEATPLARIAPEPIAEPALVVEPEPVVEAPVAAPEPEPAAPEPDAAPSESVADTTAGTTDAWPTSDQASEADDATTKDENKTV